MITLTRSDFVLACEAEKNPAAGEIEREAAAIAAKFGLLHDGNQKRFDAFNTLVPHVYPTASVERAVACAQWCNWLFFFDDLHDDDKDRIADLPRVTAQMRALIQLLKTGSGTGKSDAFSEYTLDFRARALLMGSSSWFLRFCSTVENYMFSGVLPAVESWLHGRTPRLKDYLEQRALDSATYTAIDLMELAMGLSLPEHLHRSEEIRLIRQATARSVAYFNDIVSYPKEVIEKQNPNNLVHVLMVEYRKTYVDALVHAVSIINANTLAMMSHQCEVISLDSSGRRELSRYVRGLKYLQRGNIESSLEGERYFSENSAFDELKSRVSAVA